MESGSSMHRLSFAPAVSSLLAAACLAACEGTIEEEILGTDLETDLDEVQSKVLINNALTPDDIVLNGVTVSRVLKNSLYASNLTYNTTAGSASGANAATFKNWFLNADSG